LRNYPHRLIAWESLPYIDILAGVAAVVMIFSAAWSKPLSIIARFILRFFRDPARSGGDAYLPLTVSPKLAAGKKVPAAETILADL
jgi:hypothetical protein